MPTPLEQNTSTLEAILAAVNALPEQITTKYQAKTVTPSTSAQTILPDSGYDALSQVTVSAMPTATQATPTITVNTAGKITASATQSAGYVAAGTKSATRQLTTQAAQTITPGTANKTIASGRYLTGTQTIKGDTNLIPANIAEGVSIFGVTGTHSGVEDLSAELTEYNRLNSELEEAINALPDAGSGGSGGMETCTVEINHGSLMISATYIGAINGKTQIMTQNGSLYDADLITVQKGVSLVADMGESVDWELENATIVSEGETTGGLYRYRFNISDDATLFC